MRINISEELTPIVSLGVIAFEHACTLERDDRLDQPLKKIALEMRSAGSAHLLAVRTMYRRLGLDPTKFRPSSEALLRRVRKGDPLPRINSMVDICNWCSLELQLPFGLYDRDRLDGEVELRRGFDDEQYAGIRKDVVHVGGRPTLADAHGPFGNPTSDSARTMVTTTTTRPLIVVFAPRAIGPDPVILALAVTASRVIAFTGAVEAARTVL